MKKAKPIFKSFPHFLLGGDYNPDQWLEYPEILKQDMELMKEANCNEMTVGIFAWDQIEPQEGVFDFSWLDERMDAIYQNGGRVILATPSAVHPRWLNDKHPEIMLTNETGRRLLYRERVQQCLRSPVFKEKVRMINEKLAERYAKHPALIGWHLNNEYRGYPCYCEQCQKEFREFVREKYHNNIEELNHAWWSSFWGHRFQSFDQVEPPIPTFGDASYPGLTLDWKRFVSNSVCEFAAMEAESVRKYSDAPITTNCMGFYHRYDHRKLVKHLDFYSNDCYPVWNRGDYSDCFFSKIASISSLCRNLMDKPYILMESAPGINTYRQTVKAQKSTAQQILEAMLFVATGSDSVLYFQWRKGRGGGEKYHGAIVDHLGTSEHRVFQSVKTIGEMLKKMDGVIGTRNLAEIGVVFDYETFWALDADPNIMKSTSLIDQNKYLKTLHTVFESAWKQNIPMDVIGYENDFSKYKAVILPSPYVMTEPTAQKIKEYVKNGGTVVSFYMAAMVDENDLTHLGGVPGCGLRELFGLRVDENNSYGDPADTKLTNSVSYRGKHYPVTSIADVPILEGAEQLATYEQDYFKGSSALSKNTYGKGCTYHVAFFPSQDFSDAFVGDLCESLAIKAPEAVTGEERIRVVCREGDGEKYYFVLNCSDKEQTATVHEPLYDILAEHDAPSKITLLPFGVAVLKGRA